MTVVAPSLCKHRCLLTLNHLACSENGTYPIPLSGSGDSATLGTRLPDEMFTGAQSDFGDVCLTSDEAGTTQLPLQVVWVDAANKRCEIWTANDLSVTTDRTIYAWYGAKSGTLTQPAADAEFGSQAVWKEDGAQNYLFVQHLGNSLSDSTALACNFSVDGTTPAVVAGRFGLGRRFDPDVAGSLLKDATLSLGGKFCISAWVYLYGYPTNQDSPDWGLGLAFDCNGYWDPQFHSLGVDYLHRASAFFNWSGGIAAENRGSLAGDEVPLGQWVHLASDYDQQHFSLYLNGAQAATPLERTYPAVDPNTLRIGKFASYYLGGYVDGIVDEVRFGCVSRSPSRWATTFAIESSTSLVTVGTPTTPSTGARRRRLLLCAA